MGDGAISRAVPVVKAVASEISEKNVTFMAGSIAYHAFVSLIPILLFLLLAVSLVGDEGLSQGVVGMTEGVLAPNAQQTVSNALESGSARTGASLVGAVTLLWGSLKIFRSLDTAFSEIYESESDDSFVDQVKDGLVVFFAIILAVSAAVGAGVVFAAFPEIPFIGIINPLLLIVGLVVAFFPMFYVFPDVDVSAREVVPGVLIAAVGWALLQVLFQGYFSVADRYEAYGAIGSVLALVIWLYFSGLVLLAGGVVNAVLAGRTETSRELDAGELAGAASADRSDGERAAEEEADLRERYEQLAREHAELETAHESLRKAHRARVREARTLRRRELQRKRPLWVRAKWWVFGSDDPA